MELEAPGYTRVKPVKPAIPIGACLDIPTGSYLYTKHGRAILNGGLANITGMVGIGNSFKSTCMHYMNLSAMNRIMCGLKKKTFNSTYDTEVNINENGLRRFIRDDFDGFKNLDLMDDGLWIITDKVEHYSGEFHELYKQSLKNKRTNVKSYSVDSPFLDRDGESMMKFIIPTFTQIDSFTEFESENVNNVQNNNKIGEAGGLTIHMKSGLDKTRFLMELPALVGGSSDYITLTAHIGQGIDMVTSPMPKKEVKILQGLNGNNKLKGVTGKFSFLMLNCWWTYDAKPLVHDELKNALYPKAGVVSLPGDTDLNIVTLKQLRGKNGLTNYTLTLVVSQTEGVLPSLTEFHYCKKNKNFGFSGNNINYHLDLMPKVNLMRTTVRSLLDNDRKLARAMNITSELLQIQQYWLGFPRDMWCTPAELYKDLTGLGYDMDDLLNTRGWWTVNDFEYEVPALSTMDLLNMRKGLYFPYWMNPDKTRKPQYQ